MFRKSVPLNAVTLFSVLLLSLAASASDKRASDSDGKSPKSGSEKASATPQGRPAAIHRQLVRVWVHNDDIYPYVVRVKPGRILLVVENRTLTDITLIVERVLPGQARQLAARVSAVRKAIRVNGEFVLGAGEYVFYEESQPDVKGTIIVRPPL
ncbi:MAG TPA: hypothetical protein VNN73_18735 [Blastocatellia bacterium]|nr:hypothetical protein [Blastocatellia bacterium]